MCSWSKAVTLALGLAVAMGLAAERAAADPIYNQPSTFPVSNGTAGFFYSQNDTSLPPNTNQPSNVTTGNLYQVAYDNFTLKQQSSLTAVHWQGAFNNGPGQTPVAGTITAFHISFWSSTPGTDITGRNTNLPGTLLASLTVPGNANQTLVGTEPLGGLGPNLVFNYTASLPTNFFTAQAGKEYWLEIYPDLNSSVAGNWGWHTGIGGDSASIVQTFDPAVATPGIYFKPIDLAFGLDATAVPEPSTLALLGLGCAALLGRYYSRRRSGRE
jgi:hypothetical protein